MDETNEMTTKEKIAKSISFVLIILSTIGLILGCALGLPSYNVYLQGLTGKAELSRAEYNRKILVLEAEAQKESAAMLAEVEVTRAKGVAEANKIIGDSLKNNESYLRWLWISNLKETNGQVIYIPTEAGLPILEAGKR